MRFKFTKSNLNFDVYTVASKPTTPGANNDIAIISSVRMPSWIMSPDKPSGRPRSEGVVWIQYSVSGNTFNALKNNSMMIAIANTWQYVGGAWVEVKSVSYHDGEWKQTIVYLYNAGDEFTDNTGGWVGRTWRIYSNTTAKAPTITRNADSIKMSLTASGDSADGSLSTQNKVDLTNYSKLVMNFSVASGLNGNAYLVFASGATSNVLDSVYTKRIDDVSPTNLEVDISKITGSYYICISLATYNSKTGTVTISDIHLT